MKGDEGRVIMKLNKRKGKEGRGKDGKERKGR